MTELPVWFDGMVRAASQGRFVDPNATGMGAFLVYMTLILGAYLFLGGVVLAVSRAIYVDLEHDDQWAIVTHILWPMLVVGYLFVRLATAGTDIRNLIRAWRRSRSVPEARVVSDRRSA